MAIKDKAELKAFFETGDIPTESEFGDLIDTLFGGFDSLPLRYIAHLSQSGVSAPVPVVFLNTLGAVPVWSRVASGDYDLTSAGLFPLAKRLIIVSSAPSGRVAYSEGLGASDNLITLLSFNNAGANSDNILDKTSIEIIIFP